MAISLTTQQHALRPMSEAPVVLLIGTGVGGICGGSYLKAKMGFDNFVIVEKTSKGFGGTWRHQSYPGLACDIPAHFYSFSFSPNPDWSSEFPSRAEIQPYLARVCEKYGLTPHVSFDTAIDKAVWNTADACWDVYLQRLEATDKEAGHWVGGAAEMGRKVLKDGILKVNVIINTSGVFTRPYTPDYPNQNSFKGTFMHACEWDNSVQLAGKKVAIVGSGPTAIQIVPEIVPFVGKMDVYRRSANWIQPFNNNPFTEEQKAKWRNDPAALKQKRQQTIDMAEGTWAAIENPGSPGALRMQKMCTDYLKKVVKNEKLWPLFTPNYPIGCKRICVDTGFLASFNRPNCSLVVDPIKSFTESGIVTEGGQAGGRKERDYDVIIWATGWGSFSFGRGFPCYGTRGEEIWQVWQRIGIPRSFQGVLMHEFPNLLWCVGPQGNVWSSFYEMAEQVCDFATKMLGLMIREDIASFEVKEEAEKNWADFCKRYIGNTPYRGNCISYYKFSWEHAEDAGKQSEVYTDFENPAWFPGTPMELRKARESIKLDDMILTPNKGRSWKAYASQLHPDPNFGDIGKGVSAFRLPATKSRRGPPPPEFLQIDSRVWSKL